MPFDETHPATLAGPPSSGMPTRVANQKQIRTLGGALVVLAALLSYLLLIILDAGIPGRVDAFPHQVCVAGAALCFDPSADGRLLMLVMLAGALGSVIHATTSFGDFVGNRQLSANWLWWYILKPVIGTVLATIFYLCVRGGFLAGTTPAESLNLYGIMALAGMVGMFSKQATDKLGEVFDTLFKTIPGGGDRRRSESLVVDPPPADTAPDPLALSSASAVYTPSLAMMGEREDGIDGCDIRIGNPTADEDLPLARGGVAS